MSEIERRDFLRGSLAAAGVFPFCCTTPPLPAGSVQFGDGGITVKLAAVPELRRTGAVFSVVDEPRKVNLLLIHAERGRYVAMDRSCTHGGAQCTYNPKRRTVQCTSLNHAEFNLQGMLLGGRTHGNLRAYPTEASRESVTIRLERGA